MSECLTYNEKELVEWVKVSPYHYRNYMIDEAVDNAWLELIIEDAAKEVASLYFQSQVLHLNGASSVYEVMSRKIPLVERESIDICLKKAEEFAL